MEKKNSFCFGINMIIMVLMISNWFTLSSSQSFLNLTTDEDALIAFKNSIATSILLTNWSSHTPICDWTGVTCGSKHHRVTSLNVSGFDLRGAVAPHLGNLSFLQSLDMSFNNFVGFLPPELSNLRRLQEMNMGANKLTGEIPSWFGALSQLRRLYLFNNTFSGTIPPSLSNISRLQTLNMDFNNLSGSIPEEIGSLSYLERLRFGINQLSGSIPDSIFNISSLILIFLGDNQLSGKLPENMCSQTPKLRSFTVYRNFLSGEIPPNIGKCRELELLQLQVNRFNGTIPSEIGSLSKLNRFALYINEFTGNIPMQIGNLTSLTVLIFESNNLTGTIPKQMGNLTSLQGLILGFNHLTGELPQELSNLALLSLLSVANNSLSGSIPPSIFNMSSLESLWLLQNEFSGSLPPPSMGISLPNLVELYLHYNNLSGPIPSYITNASGLTMLGLNANAFSGPMPSFGNLRLLKRLYIWGNFLTGAESPSQEMDFLSSLTNCRQLEDLQVGSNPLRGLLPSSIGNLSTSLQTFFASQCNIEGVIPSGIGNLTGLQYLYLSENQLTGFIPPALGKLRQLQIMSLDQNQLHGYIPVELCRMSSLGDLYLYGNNLTGPLPECFGEMKSLRDMDLSSNNLNFTIPATLWNLRDLITLNLSSNFFSGELSSQVSQLKVVSRLDLSSNQFSGAITDLIDGCQSLEIMNLSNNKFGGSIPQSLGKVRGLIELDLCNNNLSGMIPKSLEELRFLEHLNLSYNSLEGEIPDGGCFVNFNAQSFLHNSALCGATRFQVPPCPANHGRSRSENVARLMRYILPPLISSMILAIIIIMLIRRRRKQTKTPSPVDASVGKAWRNISYSELLRATSSFSETELLGRGSFGSVFKGKLSDGMDIAVKVFNVQTESARASKSFSTESRILSTIRHRNLVQVISCCTNMEFKALVLEFMPNGSLEKWLYSDNHSMDLLQWLKIAIDVASALEYLHHGTAFPIAHCDMKPSNVLLDEDMTALVSDFGIAKLFEEGETIIQTKTLATIGYAAPEYGSEGKVSTSVDVYSYGIILLEMFTRKKPTDDMFNGEMSLKEWVSEALQANAIDQVLAPALLLSKDDGDFAAKNKCVESIFNLAMKCVAISSDERINMIEATATLQKIKAKVAAGVTTERQPLAISIT